MRTFKFKYSFFITGLVFAALWASASVATKSGLTAAQPFVISSIRFFMAAILMLAISHLILCNRLPNGAEWKQLAVYGLLNITIYLGMYVIAMQEVSAGLGSLAVAINPVIITTVGLLWNRQTIGFRIIGSLLLGFTGVAIAAYPLLLGSHATIPGILLLISSMLVYSGGTLYFQRKKWNELHLLTINGWQTLLGGLFLLPFTLYFWKPGNNLLNPVFWLSTSWLAIGVSIGAVQTWIYLLRQNGTKASYWLFLSPIFGFIYASVLMQEPVGVWTVVGILLVLAGLYLGTKRTA
jgi:drug/metabolite transporter (DMT)-like permease